MKRKKENFLLIFVRVFSSILLISFTASFLAYLLLNGGALWQNLRYSVFLMTPFASAELREGNILEIESRISSEAEISSNSITDPVLVIPKIGINAPIITPRGNSKSAILASLDDGVGLYPGSVNPGNNGRSVILGHSSLASWYKGDYATIFSLLPNLKVGDEIIILKNGKRLKYEVFDSQIMDPDDANAYINRPSNGHEIVLITCYPIGSASQRNVVSARLIST